MKLKNKNTKFKHPKHETHLARILAALCAVALIFNANPLFAAEYDAQINATQSEVKTYEKQQVRLDEYATKLTTIVAQLNAQINEVKAQIQKNELKYNDLAGQLIYREADVKAKSDELEAVLRQAYIDNQITPIEMLASSKTLSDYMDYFEYRDRLQSQLQQNLQTLKAAKAEVVAQQKEVEVILRDGKAMLDTLNEKHKEQTQLLNQTKGQQAAYAKLISQRNSDIKDLQAQQLGANKSFFSNGKIIAGDPNKGGYPSVWADAPQDSLVDNWGMYNRECVSYTAWKVHQSGKHMPYWGGRGNANQWPSSAEADGIRTGGTPKKGAVAIAFIGPYGHAMYVEEIISGSQIRVSEFNYFVDGTYTERIIDGGGLTYVYF